MTPTGIFILCLVFGLPAIGGLWSVLMQAAKRRHQLRMQRLQLLQEALRHPQLDEATRRQMLEVLGSEHRLPMAMLLRLGYIAFLSVAWLLFLVGGVCWILGQVQGWSWRDMEESMVATIVGFALLTLPMAVRELLRRDRSAAATRQ